jgi:hypothetical protein
MMVSGVEAGGSFLLSEKLVSNCEVEGSVMSNGRVVWIASRRYLGRQDSEELVRKEGRVGCVRLNEPQGNRVRGVGQSSACGAAEIESGRRVLVKCGNSLLVAKR